MKQAVFVKSLTVALNPEVHEQIKAITDDRHISMGEWVRAAVEAALNNNKKKEENIHVE